VPLVYKDSDSLRTRTSRRFALANGFLILDLRSGTSVGANYRAAGCGRSKAEFIAKLGTVEEEADEPAYGMELIVDGGLLPKAKVEALRQEASELTAIMVSPCLSAKARRQIANRKSS